MNIATELYLARKARWPKHGRSILAQFDAESVVVYQAYRPEISRFAARPGYFGGGERGFSKAKSFQRFATRHEKLKEMYLGVVRLVFGLIHVRKLSRTVSLP